MCSTAPMTQMDQELVTRAQAGCSFSVDTLVCTYQRVVRRMASRFFLPGADREDIVQEGMVGLALAIRTYEPRFGRTFHDFATMCVRNALIRAVRGATRKKHQVLNGAADLDGVCNVAESTEQTDEAVLQRMCLRQLWSDLAKRLSELELDALRRRMEGESAEDIARRYALSLKQVENALFRARQKARAVMASQQSRGLQAA